MRSSGGETFQTKNIQPFLIFISRYIITKKRKAQKFCITLLCAYFDYKIIIFYVIIGDFESLPSDVQKAVLLAKNRELINLITSLSYVILISIGTGRISKYNNYLEVITYKKILDMEEKSF